MTTQELNALADGLSFAASNTQGCLYSQRKMLSEAASALRTAATSQASVNTMRELLPPLLKTLSVMRSARQKDGLMCVWEDDEKAVSDIAAAIDNIEVQASVETATPAQEVVVKPLVWGAERITGEVGVMAQDAYTTVGTYIAADNGWFLSGQSGWNKAHTRESAKAAAQADYEQRIRSALMVAPAPSGTEALREALDLIEYASRKDSLSDRERLQDIRSIVCAAISKHDAALSTPAQQAVDAEAVKQLIRKIPDQKMRIILSQKDVGGGRRAITNAVLALIGGR